MGDPILLQRSEPISDPTDPDILELVQDLLDTVADVGGAGLAAPQIGVLKRVFVYAVPPGRALEDESEDPSFGMTPILNPRFEPVGADTSLVWEGCLSIPGMRGAVPRPNRIRYAGLRPDGSTVETEASGFHARVFQHEFDHLEGVLYPMRMEDFRLFGFNEELTGAAISQRPLDESS